MTPQAFNYDHDYDINILATLIHRSEGQKYAKFYTFQYYKHHLISAAVHTRGFNTTEKDKSMPGALFC